MTVVPKSSADCLRETFVSRILGQLSSNMPVLILLSGGSAAPVGAAICRDLEHSLSGDESAYPVPAECMVTLVDERFGPAGHPDSNWNFFTLKDLPWKQLIPVPVLTATDNNPDLFLETVRKFDGFLSWAVTRHTQGRLFIAAVFGIGEDGHTAGILPDSPASLLSTSSPLYATGYHHAPYSRITMTPSFFPSIDLAMVWASGTNKRKPLESLLADSSYERMPAQLLKLPRETIMYTDQEVNAHEKT